MQQASKDDALSTKLCHKCAYEIDKCCDFVQNYKKKVDQTSFKKVKKSNCNFCQKPGKEGYLFKLRKTNKYNDAFDKIYYLFEDDVSLFLE